MKNIFLKSAALIAVLTMTMSGCSNEELTGDKGQTEMEGISSITLETPQDGPSTRLEYNTDNITQALGVKWKAGRWIDASTICERAVGVNVFYDAFFGLILARGDEGGPTSKAEFLFANFSQGGGKNLKKDFSFGLLYPYKSDYSAAFNLNGSYDNTVEATLPLNGQTGVLADMQNFDYMTTLGTVPSDVSADKDLSVTFKHRIAVMRLTGLTFPAGTAGTATSIAISGTGLMTDAKLTFTEGAKNTLTESLVLGSTEGAITTTGTFNITNNVLDDVYICFFPGNVDATGTHQITDLKVTATVGSDTYEYNYGADATVTNKVEKFVEGKMYTLEGKSMTKK